METESGMKMENERVERNNPRSAMQCNANAHPQQSWKTTMEGDLSSQLIISVSRLRQEPCFLGLSVLAALPT